MPIFGIPCIPSEYKIPIVFPCLAPQEKFSITFSLLLGFFSFKKRNNQTRAKSENINGIVFNSHWQKRQCSRSLEFRVKVFYACSKDVSPDGQLNGEGRAWRPILKCMCLRSAFMHNGAQLVSPNSLTTRSC